ncbi:hypothetical protein GCM10010840_33930 [Deinococcus aerolatus]|uniref:Uncharacterized protein n=1 Tax=Deinococcus aerolatus TaxID=522487 RepID=A0ABQ2GFL5_9DEIO|nr:hypothetical protein [Deinococcus aerolatus]GGL93111.1 hypothetical protein GCM10010840_33930 [Deinococcus aerolatus]
MTEPNRPMPSFRDSDFQEFQEGHITEVLALPRDQRYQRAYALMGKDRRVASYHAGYEAGLAACVPLPLQARFASGQRAIDTLQRLQALRYENRHALSDDDLLDDLARAYGSYDGHWYMLPEP